MSGIERIIKERQRQIEEEGWSAEHDDEHTDGSLALAAICYATPIKIYKIETIAGGFTVFDPWPESWAGRYDKRFRYGENKTKWANYIPKPDTYTKDERLDLLTKAGALIAAEIDRLER